MSKKDIIKHKKGEVIREAKIDGKKEELDYKVMLITLLCIIIILILLIF
jgi:hypothetical protein